MVTQRNESGGAARVLRERGEAEGESMLRPFFLPSLLTLQLLSGVDA